MPDLDLATPEEMLDRLERAVVESPADATEIAWIELRRGEATGKRRREGSARPARTVLVRVRERGRTGFHRAGEAGASELATAVREALALARLGPPDPPPAMAPNDFGLAAALPAAPPGPAGPPATLADLFDEEIARLDEDAARNLVQRLAGRGDAVRLGWVEGRVAVATSGGVRRSARATAATIEAGRARRPGAGRAAGAARSLAALDPAGVVERARAREGTEQTGDLPADGAPLLLSPEATAALLDLLNRLALSSVSFREGTSPLRGRLGEPVFAPAVHLRDDGTRADGLPFPFDLLGAAKYPVDLVSAGTLLTPAVDERLAAEIGRPTTPHAVAPDEALATHLFLLPGDRPEEELARELGDGAIWVGALEPVECFDPFHLRFRAWARGVRRIEGGTLGGSLPDLAWEDSLAEVLARVVATGARPVVLAGAEPLLGGISTPSMALSRAASLRPLGDSAGGG